MATERFIIEVSTRGTAQARKSIQGIGRSADQTRRLLGFLRAALVVFASIAILRGLANFIDTLTRLNNKLRLVTGAARELATVQAGLFKISQKTRTEFEGNVDLFSKLARTTTQLKLTYGDLLEVTEAVALATKISGSEAQTAANGIQQFGQALASGVLAGDELRSVTENLTRLAAVIGKEFNVAGAGLRAFAKANPGVITTQRIVKALRAEFGQLQKELIKTRITILDAFVKFNNQLVLFLGGLGDSINLGQKVDTVLQFIARHLVQIALALAALTGLVVFNLIIGQVALLNARILLLGSVIFSMVVGVARLFTVLLAPFILLQTVLVGVGGVAAVVFSPLVAVMAVLFKVVRLVTAAFLGMVVSIRAIGVAATVSAGALRLLLLPILAIKAAFAALAAVVLANPLFLIGAAVVGSLVTAFVLFREEINAVVVSLGGLKGIMDIVLAATVATANIMISSWRDLPAVAGDVGVQVANAFIKSNNAIIKSVNSVTISVTRFFDDILAHTSAALVFAFRELQALSAFLKLQFAKAINFILKGLESLGGAAETVLNALGADIKFEPIELFDTEQMEKDVLNINESLEDFNKALVDIRDSGPITGFFKEFEEFGLLVNENAGAANEVAQKWVDEFERIKASNPTDFLIKKFQGLADFLKTFLSENLVIDPEILKLFPTIAGGGVTTANIEALGRATGSLIASVSPLAAVTIKLEQAQKLLNEAATKGIDIFVRYGITSEEVLRRLQRDLVGAGNAATNFAEGMKNLDNALSSGAINTSEYSRLVRGLRIEFLDTQTDAMAGFERGLLKIADVAVDSASLIEDSLTTAFDAANQAFSDFIETGKFNFKDFVRTILAELAKLIFKQLLAQSITFGAGLLGLAKGGSFTVADTPGFAHGGAFSVANSGNSGGGTDSQLVAFRATPGERVTVETPAQQRDSDAAGGSAAAPIVPVSIVNVLEPGMMLDAIDTVEGERKILNIMERNPASMRRILSR